MAAMASHRLGARRRRRGFRDDHGWDERRWPALLILVDRSPLTLPLLLSNSDQPALQHCSRVARRLTLISSAMFRPPHARHGRDTRHWVLGRAFPGWGYLQIVIKQINNITQNNNFFFVFYK